MSKTARQGLGAIFAVPLLIALATTIGLVSALTGDGWRDWLSWGTLAVPVAVTWWALQSRRG
jgi:hypothetical protein